MQEAEIFAVCHTPGGLIEDEGYAWLDTVIADAAPCRLHLVGNLQNNPNGRWLDETGALCVTELAEWLGETCASLPLRPMPGLFHQWVGMVRRTSDGDLTDYGSD